LKGNIIMNTKLISLAVLSSSLLFAQGAIAAGPSTEAPMYVATSNAPYVLTRAEVKLDARNAEMSAQIPRGQQAWPAFDSIGAAGLSRSEVKAETRIAMATHSIPRGQQSFISYVAPQIGVSRAEVKSETRLAEAAHQIPRGEANVNR
jgi:hypothetical protein